MPEATLAREIDLEYVAICPIVNHAAGIGDSVSKISHDTIVANHEQAFNRVANILAAFVS